MRIRELETILYDDRTATLRVTGLNPFKKNKTVRIAVDDPEKFLNAIKLAFSAEEGKIIKFDEEGRIVANK
ncbi:MULTISPECIES: hypothetical protein [unclassified Phyllobacterium]|uniref:hypothetical protein n=1 Tax=unclassified Phyllobacterium TaxID=2638441 RepID=UPI003012B9A9